MKPKQLFFILIAITTLLVAAGGAGYYYALTTVQTTQTKIADQEAQSNAADAEIQYIGKLSTQYAHEIVPILPLIDEALPRTKNQTEILAQLQSLAGGAGLAISSVTFASAQGLPTNTSQTVASGGVLALPISFQVQGSYAQLQTFLTSVENLSRYTNVTTLAITRPDKTKPIVYAMTVNAYVKP
ncbi:MAG TPA: type 4a pilus biogenesis protein PilO [Candidatus Saccharimonadia bacterium]|nr:type 4a pilus biogenesis protein PilO [Candidatus Saccharimonadia bacterium]